MGTRGKINAIFDEILR